MQVERLSQQAAEAAREEVRWKQMLDEAAASPEQRAAYKPLLKQEL